MTLLIRFNRPLLIPYIVESHLVLFLTAAISISAHAFSFSQPICAEGYRLEDSVKGFTVLIYGLS